MGQEVLRNLDFAKKPNSEKNRKFTFPIPRVGRRIGCSVFLSRHPFAYFPIASYGIIFAAKWSRSGGIESVVSK